MSLSPATLTGEVRPGNDAGWLLSFHREREDGTVDDKPILEISRNDYYAEIQATLPGGLEGGAYTFTVEGLTDAHYAAIAQGKPDSPTVVRLYLFWRDTNSSVLGYLKNLSGLTDAFGLSGKDIPEALLAVLRIQSVTRRLGSRRYETVITARERLFDLAERTRLPQAVTGDTLEMALDQLLQGPARLRKEADYVFHGVTPNPACPPTAGPPASERRELEAGRTVLDTLRDLAAAMEAESGCHGRGLLLIRSGVLHLGVRPVPLEGEVRPVTFLQGLIETEALEPVPTDPNFDTSTGGAPPVRRQFRLTLKGRPDLKPGDLIEFDLPPEDVSTTTAGALGALGDLLSSPLLPTAEIIHPVQLYVQSVQHRLGRTSAFATVLTGVEVTGAEDAWDCHTPASRAPAGAEILGASASPETEAARAVLRAARRETDNASPTEVGEVRGMTTQGAEEPPAQTVTVWRGLQPGDGRSGQAHRLAVQRPSPGPATGVPYATPFAWGRCGLVLPRYPGTRVVVTHRGGRRDDPIEIGAVWESGHGPDSQPGDWWLSLPVGVPEQQRSTLAEDTVPAEHTGKVTNDLTDADGNRVIEVGELTVRVGRDTLGSAGTRPARGETDGVTIEHSSGARIVVKQDGTVLIEAAQDLELKAGGDIKMDAANVKVTVSGSMDVS